MSTKNINRIDDICCEITDLEERYLNPESKMYLDDTEENKKEKAEIVKEVGDLYIEKTKLEKQLIAESERPATPLLVFRQKGRSCNNAWGLKKRKSCKRSKKRKSKKKGKRGKKRKSQKK
jgi:hypothetical protein